MKWLVLTTLLIGTSFAQSRLISRTGPTASGKPKRGLSKLSPLTT